MSAEYAAAEHESRHIVSAWHCGLDVLYAGIGAHAAEEGIVEMAPTDDGAADLLTRILGWLADDDKPTDAPWPPPYDLLLNGVPSDPDGLAWSVRHYRLSRQEYEEVCNRAEELVADQVFVDAVRLVARALQGAPMLDRESLEVLRAATGFADKEAVICGEGKVLSA